MERPLALVTNDDGIDSTFVHGLATALAEHFDILVAAPAHEQSWSSRSFTRRGDIAVVQRTDLPWPAWSIDGTPSDCVNLACGNLVPRTPDIVVSGLNVGFNVSLPLILASGTVAAALEGSMWNLPALAVSIALPNEAFNQVKSGEYDADGPIGVTLKNASNISARFARKLVGQPTELGKVHNLNFPFGVQPDTPITPSQLAPLELGGFFQESRPGIYRFQFPHGRPRPTAGSAYDYTVLTEGQISHTVLQFGRVG